MSPKKEIGDPLEQVVRTGKIGSSPGVQKPGNPATQTSNSPDVQTLERPSFQKSGSLETQTSSSPATQKSRSLTVPDASNSEVQTSSSPEVKPDRVQRTIYLSRGLAKWIKIRAALEEREISALAEDAFLLYRRHVERDEQ